jgi:cell division protein FtsA
MDKLSAGIVLTGGGSLMRNLPQLVKFRSGMDVRIGYPNERLGNDSTGEVNDPMYSTSVGLLLKGYEILSHSVSGEKNRQQEEVPEFVTDGEKERKGKEPIAGKTETPDTDEATESPKKTKKVRDIINGFIGFFDDNSTPM